MILSADCQDQLTQTAADPVQLGPISRHVQIIFNSLVWCPCYRKQYNIKTF